ncbi:galactofuranose ABC transporter, ATP-binding protein YtfR [Pannonibacter phragmitetus]|uniref:Sugar ABC transporter ATP-binding protein n=1 Tax=Pannonibacter phragmitetus TaxID=121719 RepID=A0A0U3NZA6_9HYPH|nr:galactofuranose ABC transporter, ATP-binding protein YtfR [Pannonibacter phragmitetus]ALV26582.1 sugar ABC transporter ATP-binding protein [Pannonibacter phragmitetus]
MTDKSFHAGPQHLLQATGITKSFPGALALDNVDFTLQAGEVHALLGENGAGKSTLVKCLTGAYRRDRGDILLEGRRIDPRDTLDAQTMGIGTVYQEVNLLGNLTVAENLFLGRQPMRFGMVHTREMEARAKVLLAGYGLDIDVRRSLSAYPVAVQQIIAIARAADLSGKVMILDEPTASLDTQEVEMLFNVVRGLKARGLGIVFISHFLDQVYEICDTVTILRNGRKVATRAALGLPRLDLVALMLGRDLEAETRERAVHTAPEGEAALQFRQFGRKGHVAPFDLAVHPGEVVGMAGLLGSGRTETAEVLFGAAPADTGEARMDGRVLKLGSPRQAIAEGFAFCPEDRKHDGIIAELSIRENIALALQARRGWMRPVPRKEQVALADKYIKALDIRTTSREKPIGQLSGGNQQKALLARWLALNPKFLILDEPTRGIDVGAHAEIIRLIEDLCAKGMSLLVISSELEELVVYSHRVIVVRDRAHVAELTGEDVTPHKVMQAIAEAGHGHVPAQAQARGAAE